MTLLRSLKFELKNELYDIPVLYIEMDIYILHSSQGVMRVATSRHGGLKANGFPKSQVQISYVIILLNCFRINLSLVIVIVKLFVIVKIFNL